MKKILLILSMTLMLSGCSNTEENSESTNPETTDPPIIVEQEKEIITLSRGNDILLEQSTTVVKNKMQINGLTTFETLNITIKDDAGNLLNSKNTTIDTTEKENSWRQFVKYLYLDKMPQSETGVLTIYSDADNYVTLPINFEPYEDKPITILYPTREMEQTNFIRVVGKTFSEKSIQYTIESLTGDVIKSGEIAPTNVWPDLGVFAIDIPLEVESQDLYLKIYDEIIKIKFIKN